MVRVVSYFSIEHKNVTTDNFYSLKYLLCWRKLFCMAEFCNCEYLLYVIFRCIQYCLPFDEIVVDVQDDLVFETS